MPRRSLDSRPVRVAVPGAPFRPGQRVTVVASAEPSDPRIGIDVCALIGLSGVVEYFEYSCGCGQSYPRDPMIGVVLEDRIWCEFWREELMPNYGGE